MKIKLENNKFQEERTYPDVPNTFLRTPPVIAADLVVNVFTTLSVLSLVSSQTSFCLFLSSVNFCSFDTQLNEYEFLIE